MPIRRPPGPMRLVLVWLVGVLVAGTAAAEAHTVRVLLADGLAATELAVDGAHEGSSDRGGAFATQLALSWPLRWQDGDVHVGSRAVGGHVEVTALEGGVRWRGRSYRGVLRVEAGERGLRVVNRLDLEAYLRGVVAAEMQASWPMEALKAQAVAARSYTLASLSPSAPWDVCASRSCQVYRGMQAEHPRTDAAVRATAGVVLSWNEQVVQAYYHADSGGTIASSAEVWGAARPYLPGQADVAVTSPHRNWTHTLDPHAVAAQLREAGTPIGRPQRVTVVRFGRSGRVVAAEVVGDAGRVRLSGPAWTRAARAWGLKSTRFRMVGPLTARGDGWGHGVGMSQYGARALALAGYGWGRILAFYYPGTGLQRRTVAAAR